MSQWIGPPNSPETHSQLYRPTGAVEMASLCLNVMRCTLPVRLKRIGIANHCLSPSFLCCPRRQPWQMIRQKRDRRIGLVSAQTKTTKCAIGLKNFGVSPEQLKAAVRKVGNSAK